MTILSKACKPDNFELHNSLKLSFTNIWGLGSNFVDCKSFLESNSPEILALCETDLDDSIDSGNFSVRCYLPLIQKVSGTHMHGLAVYVKEGLLFAWGLSLENSGDSYVLDWLYFAQCLTSFSSVNHLLCLCARFLILFHPTLIRFSQSTHLLMFLSLEILMSIIKTGLPILVELIDLVNFVIIFLSQMTLLRWLAFLRGSQTVILIVVLFWTDFFLLTLVYVLQWLSPQLEILIMLLSQFP